MSYVNGTRHPMNRRREPSKPLDPGSACLYLTIIAVGEFFAALSIPGDPQLGENTTGLFIFVLFLSFGTGFLAWRAWLAHKKRK